MGTSPLHCLTSAPSLSTASLPLTASGLKHAEAQPFSLPPALGEKKKRPLVDQHQEKGRHNHVVKWLLSLSSANECHHRRTLCPVTAENIKGESSCWASVFSTLVDAGISWALLWPAADWADAMGTPSTTGSCEGVSRFQLMKYFIFIEEVLPPQRRHARYSIVIFRLPCI